MSRLFLIFTFLTTHLISSFSSGADYSFFYAAGPGYVTPGSVRGGVNNWEVGLLTPSTIGLCQFFPIGGLPYVAFGPALINGQFGLYGSMGLFGKLLWKFYWRTELQSAVSFGGATSGGGILGLQIIF